MHKVQNNMNIEEECVHEYLVTSVDAHHSGITFFEFFGNTKLYNCITA